jgi:hypothetical protein
MWTKQGPVNSVSKDILLIAASLFIQVTQYYYVNQRMWGSIEYAAYALEAGYKNYLNL